MSVIAVMFWLMDHLAQHVLEEGGVLNSSQGKHMQW
jgi:hypothetical protein